LLIHIPSIEKRLWNLSWKKSDLQSCSIMSI